MADIKLKASLQDQDVVKTLKVMNAELDDMVRRFIIIKSQTTKTTRVQTRAFNKVKDAVQEIGKELATTYVGSMDKALKIANSNAEKSFKSLEKTHTRSFDKMKQNNVALVMSLETLGRYTKAISVDLINMVANYEDSMAAIQRSGTSAKQAALPGDAPISERMMLSASAMAPLEREILNLYSNMPIREFDQLAGIFYEVAQSGLEGTQTIYGVSEAIAKLSFTIRELSAQKLTEHVTMIGTGFGLGSPEDYEKLGSAFVAAGAQAAGGVDKIIEAMRRFMPQATMFGLTVQQSVALMGTLVAMGNPAERSGTQMGNALMEIAEKAELFAETTGQSLEQVKQDFMTPEGIMGQLTAYLQRVGALENPIERVNKLSELLGKVGVKSIGLLISAFDKFEAMLKDVNSAYSDGELLQQAYDLQINTLKGSVLSLINSFNALKIRVGQQIGNTLVPIIDSLKQGIQNLSKSWDNLDESTKKSISQFLTISGIFVTLLPLLGAIGFILKTLTLSPLTLGVAGLISSVAAMGSTLANEFSMLTSNAFTWGDNFIKSFFNGMVTAVNTGANILVSAVNGIAAYFRSYSPPKQGPLKDIERWGTNIMETFLRAFGQADFSVLSTATSMIEVHMRSVGAIMEQSTEQVAENISKARQVVTDFIQQLRTTGDVTLGTQQALIDAVGIEKAKGITAEASATIDVDTATTALESARGILETVLAQRDAILKAGEINIKHSQMALDSSTAELKLLSAMGMDMFDEEYRAAYERAKEAENVLKEEQNRHKKELIQQNKKVDAAKTEVELRQQELNDKKEHLDNVKALNRALLEEEQRRLSAIQKTKSAAGKEVASVLPEIPTGGVAGISFAIDLPNLENIGKNLSNLARKIKNLIPEDVRLAFANFLDFVANKLIPLLQKVANPVLRILKTSFEVLASVIRPFLVNSLRYLTEILNSIVIPILNITLVPILNLVASLFEKIGGVVKKVAPFIGDALASLLVFNVFKASLFGLEKIFGPLMVYLSDLGTLFWNVGVQIKSGFYINLGKMLTKISSAGMQILTGLTNPVSLLALTIGTILVAKIKKSVEEIENWLLVQSKMSDELIKNSNLITKYGEKTDKLREIEVALNQATRDYAEALQTKDVEKQIRSQAILTGATVAYKDEVKKSAETIAKAWGLSVEEVLDDNGNIRDDFLKTKNFLSAQFGKGLVDEKTLKRIKDSGFEITDTVIQEFIDGQLKAGQAGNALTNAFTLGLTSEDAITKVIRGAEFLDSKAIEALQSKVGEFRDQGELAAFMYQYGATDEQIIKTVYANFGEIGNASIQGIEDKTINNNSAKKVALLVAQEMANGATGTPLEIAKGMGFTLGEGVDEGLFTKLVEASRDQGKMKGVLLDMSNTLYASLADPKVQVVLFNLTRRIIDIITGQFKFDNVFGGGVIGNMFSSISSMVEKFDFKGIGSKIFTGIAGGISGNLFFGLDFNKIANIGRNMLIRMIPSEIVRRNLFGLNFATGGIVPEIQGYARGGVAGLNRRNYSTDTVPAMLTPGELILNAAQQKTLAQSIGALVTGFSVPGSDYGSNNSISNSNQSVYNINTGMMIASEGEVRNLVRMLDRYREVEKSRYGYALG
jgi:TP901 family phage tail tape measure protein